MEYKTSLEGANCTLTLGEMDCSQISNGISGFQLISLYDFYSLWHLIPLALKEPNLFFHWVVKFCELNCQGGGFGQIRALNRVASSQQN